MIGWRDGRPARRVDGVATGDVVVGQASKGQHVLTGEAMQTSTVMEQNAPPFEVLISQGTSISFAIESP